MNPIDIIDKTVNSKTVEKAYDDAVSKPAKQLGELAEDFLKTIRLLSFPLQITAVIQDKLENGSHMLNSR